MIGLSFLDSGAGIWRGLAKQYAVGPDLEPQNFGVLFLLSLFCYLTDRRRLGLLAVVPAPLIHPGFVIPTLIYLSALLVADRRSLRERPPSYWLAGAMVVTACLGHVAYLAWQFAATSQENAAQASEIIARRRIPHHADVAVWLLSFDGFLRVALLLAATALAWRTRIGDVLMVGIGVMAVLTGTQVLTGSNELAIIAPWRASTWLSPLAVTVLLAWIIGAVTDRLDARRTRNPRAARALWILVGAALLGMGVLGAARKVHTYPRPDPGYARYLRKHADDRTLVLSDPREEEVRLAIQAPVLATWKSHPYQDIEVIAWYRRVQDAFRLFDDATIQCATLRELTQRYGATHLLVLDRRTGVDCALAKRVFEDASGRVYRLSLQ